jgi:hypothetical protein
MSGRRLTHLIAGALTLVLASCAIPLDERPRAMESTNSDANPIVTVPSAGDTAAYVYMLLDGSLVPAPREVEARTAGPVLDAVVQPPTSDETSRGYITQVPSGTTVLGSVQNGDLLSVDLSREFENVIGRARQEAIGQFVFTATELPGIAELTFSIDGTPLQVNSPTRGDVERVMDCDFLSLLPTDDKISASGISTEAARRVIIRRQNLMERCPLAETRMETETGG